MIVYDKEQKQIVIPNGLGNVDIYNDGYVQGEADMVAKARVLNVTENGTYASKYSDPIFPDTYTVTGVYADGTKFYNYASVRDNIFNTKIAATTDSRLEFWYKGENPESGDKKNIIIGAGDEDNIHCFEVSYNDNNNILRVQIGNSAIGVSNWDDTIWHHLIISKAEGLWIDGDKKGDFSPSNTINGEFFINGINYNVSSSSANGYFGMIKIDDTTIIPTADGFLNTNTGELLEVVKGNGSYKLIEKRPIYGEGELYKAINVNVPSYDEGQADLVAEARVLNVTENGVYRSRYSDPIVPEIVTGVYPDGTEFYSYANLGGDIFNTKIAGSIDSRLEFWYKGDNAVAPDDYYDIIIGAADNKRTNSFQIRYYAEHNDTLWVEIDDSKIEVNNWDDTVWHHLIVSRAEGLWIDGEKKGDFSPTTNTINGEFYINGAAYDKYRNRTANGSFGMIKIDDTIIIPAVNGFLNTNTGEMLEKVKKGTYVFWGEEPFYPKGALYKTINVNVPDLNGSYNEGYEQGQADAGANARVLEVTENGVYKSKFSDPIIPTTVTGVYGDGTNFYSYAELKGKVFNTKIAATVDSRLEFWYKGDNTSTGFGDNIIIGAGNNDDNNCFQVRYYEGFNGWVKISIGNSTIDISNWGDTVWHHLIISKAEGLWVDGEKKGDFTASNTINGEFFINGISYDTARNANGTFGMVKIDDVVFIPTANGFKNVNTDELLQVVKDGTYNFTENLPIYGEGELYKTINVNIDVDSYYNNGYAQGKTDGINEQKGKLTQITISENGTYRKEDGYSEVVVNVPDLNGSYDEGYNQGKEDAAANARVLDVTENGVYRSKFSDPIFPDTYTVTGVYADGTKFYNYAELNGKIFNTKIAGTIDSRLEFWYKGDNTANDAWNTIIGSGNNDNSDCFQVRYYVFYNTWVEISIGNSTKDIQDWDDTVWHHLIVSKAEGLWIDGKKRGDFTPTNTINGEFFINGIGHNADGSRSANGTFGMIKIDDVVFIPTANGFQNVNTGELLEVVNDGGYKFTETPPIYPEGELYKTINVNVLPKVNVKEAGLKFGQSTFTEVPEWADFKDVTDMSNMFHLCGRLQTIPPIDTSNVTNMNRMFYYCSNLQAIPMINTGNVTNMSGMFYSCDKLQTIPPINTSNVSDMDEMFYSCFNLKTIPALDARNLLMESYQYLFGYSDLNNLTDFGGFLNLKSSLENDKNLKKLPNLTYQSCINVLNGLYDFVAAGETPNSSQGKLKVHQNFLDKVGDKISIGVAKGWVISA